jgi:hypothetical protein
MSKKVIIAHGWGGHPEENWFPWLKNNLEERNFEVIIPQLPIPKNPKIQNWVPALNEVVGDADEETYFVGHSLGCQTIARYLESLPEDLKVGGVVFVAGFFDEVSRVPEEIVEHWMGASVDLKKVKKHFDKSVALFSDDDPHVPIENIDSFRDVLGSEIILQNKKGHFGSRDACFELPIVLDSILKLSGMKK